jgi:CubicO group peptidase (beta-lactamase class C family)
MMLVEDGRLKLDDFVSDYIPVSRLGCKEDAGSYR